MLINYLKTVLRHIAKNKGFSLLNILGLSLGLTCSMLILLWIQDEVSYNTFNKKYNDLYQVMENHNYDGKIYTFAATPGLLAGGMKAEMPEVANAARMAWGERWLFSSNETPVFENGNYVDPAFFSMFSFDFIYGSAATALPNDKSIVITDVMAKKFFGDANPLGKYLKVNDQSEYTVTGVVKNAPLNSSIQFNWLASFKIFEKQNDWWKSWSNNGMQTFVELKPGVSQEAFNKKFSHYIQDKSSESSALPFLMPMKDWRLKSNFEEGKQAGGRIEYVRLFGFIAFLLIVVACINFMNLATARSEQRSKEVGVRKVMGARRSSLMVQFMGESIILSVISTAIACTLAILFLPSFNELVGKKLSSGMNNPVQWLALLGISLFCGLISGSYPSLYLSSFNPIRIFRGRVQGGNSSTLLVRKGLVITQFVVSIVLIISTVIIYKQIEHVKKRNLGYNRNNLIYMHQRGKMNERLEVIEQDLLATGVVADAATCNQSLLQLGNNTGGFNWEGKDASTDVLITTEYVSPGYIHTAGMTLAQGRDFNKDAAKDSGNVIINETLAGILHQKNTLNTLIRQDNAQYKVVGVVKDFVFNDMYKKPDPVIIFCQPHATNKFFVRLHENSDVESALKKVEAVFKKDNPGYPFEYNFLDTEFDKQFKSEMLISRLSRLFAIITIVISCLGLFGLAAHTAERRTKEIGIRKVLGASVQNLVTLLSKDFLKLVLIAIVIASPLAWYFMNSWLQDYAYRIHIPWWIFAAAGCSALLIAFITVSFQAVKAAIINPVKSLRSD